MRKKNKPEEPKKELTEIDIPEINYGKPIAIDLFSGAGGFSLGMEKAGFDVVCSVEYHPDPMETYKNNRTENKDRLCYFNQDISMLKGKNITSEIRKKNGKKIEIDTIISGPPCQGFSLRGKSLVDDPRNKLVGEYFRIIEEINPKSFVFENVLGIMGKKYKTLDFIFQKIKDLNYNFNCAILNSSDFGVPQNRRRFIIIGSKSNDDIYFPYYNNKNKNLLSLYRSKEIQIPKVIKLQRLKKKVTVYEALDDIACEKNEKLPTPYPKSPKSVYQKYIRVNNKNNDLNNHRTTRHKPKTKEMFSMFKPGDTILNLPEKYRNKRRTVQRMIPDSQSRTITSCNEDFIHYSQDRIITIREMARLQSFPDNYIFYGTPTTGGDRRKFSVCQVQQVANSVPPLLGQAIGEAVLKILDYNSNKKLDQYIKSLNRRKIVFNP